MKAAVLYSGGKDSSLVAVMLQRLGYKVELVTANFGVFPSWKSASKSASCLGFKHHVLSLDHTIMEEAVDIILNDEFPNHGINQLHREVLKLAAEKYPVLADGTRRDDRVPKLNLNEIQSLEDSKGVQYLNLAGWGHKTINQLSEQLFNLVKEPTNMDNNSDYEIEIRCLINQMEGKDTADKLFPPHIQSRVIGWRKDE
ncbi:MAG: Asparagine synthase [Methanobacterium sp. PtaB.Bin024]|jgi:predicted subunit of tRNA(5-methylaminomethyl-2-thiouridylate) methyltransferase|nr:MAG: Asparagine synthase [Methanobacterium sp. PtaB.Bin024]